MKSAKKQFIGSWSDLTTEEVVRLHDAISKVKGKSTKCVKLKIN